MPRRCFARISAPAGPPQTEAEYDALYGTSPAASGAGPFAPGSPFAPETPAFDSELGAWDFGLPLDEAQATRQAQDALTDIIAANSRAGLPKAHPEPPDSWAREIAQKWGFASLSDNDTPVSGEVVASTSRGDADNPPGDTWFTDDRMQLPFQPVSGKTTGTASAAGAAPAPRYKPADVAAAQAAAADFYFHGTPWLKHPTLPEPEPAPQPAPAASGSSRPPTPPGAPAPVPHHGVDTARMPAGSPARDANALAMGSATLRKGTYDKAGALADGLAHLATSPGRTAFMIQDQPVLDDLWEKIQALRKAREKEAREAPVQPGLAGVWQGLNRFFAGPGEEEKILLERARRLSNNPGWWDAGNELREEGHRSYAAWDVDENAHNAGAKAGRLGAGLVDLLSTGGTGKLATAAGAGLSVLQRYSEERERIAAQLRAEGGATESEINEIASTLARSQVEQQLPWLLASAAAGKVGGRLAGAAGKVAPQVAARLGGAIAPQVAARAARAVTEVGTDVAANGLRHLADGESFAPTRTELLAYGAHLLAGTALPSAPHQLGARSATRRSPVQPPLPRLEVRISTAKSVADLQPYLQRVESITEIPIGRKQRQLLNEALRSKSFPYVSPEWTHRNRLQFTPKVKRQIIREWEAQNNANWPRHTSKVVDKRERTLKNIGDLFEPHHIIPNAHGGPHTWWNFTPAAAPRRHQNLIHEYITFK